MKRVGKKVEMLRRTLPQRKNKCENKKNLEIKFSCHLLPYQKKSYMNMEMTKITYFITSVTVNTAKLLQQNRVLRKSKAVVPRELCRYKGQDNVLKRNQARYVKNYVCTFASFCSDVDLNMV